MLGSGGGVSFFLCFLGAVKEDADGFGGGTGDMRLRKRWWRGVWSLFGKLS